MAQNAITIVDDPTGRIPRHLLPMPAHYRDTVESILIPHGLVRDRCGGRPPTRPRRPGDWTLTRALSGRRPAPRGQQD